MSDERPDEYRAPRSAVAFMDSLAVSVPAAGLRIQDERRYHHGNPHPHLEMAAVAAWFVSACERTWRGAPDAEHAASSIHDLLGFLERRFHSGDTKVDDVISGSFLENLQTHPQIERIRGLLPPKLEEFYSVWIAGNGAKARERHT